MLCPFACDELECYILYSGALTSSMIDNTHTRTHCQIPESIKNREEDRDEKERKNIYGDILLLMSAPPLGSISLTFMLDHSIPLSFSVSYFLFSSFFLHIPSLLPIIQLAFPLLCMNLIYSTLACAVFAAVAFGCTHAQGNVCKHTHFPHIHVYTCNTPSLLQYLLSPRVQCIRTSSDPVNACSFLLSPSQRPVCQANQARAAAYLNGFGNWQWEQHLHTVLQINNRLLSGPMRRRKRSACSCQPLRALRQMSGRW